MSNQVKLSTKQSIAWKYLEDPKFSKVAELLYGGAAGGGKSWLGCLWQIHRRTTYPGTRGLVGRAKLSTLKQSTLVTYLKACKALGYRAGKDYIYNAQDHIITWSNESVTVLKDLFHYPADPDYESLGSTDYTDAFIDEATEISLKAFDIVKSRVRDQMKKHDLKPKILLTSNPRPGWVKSRFVSDDQGNDITLREYQRFVRAKVTDNPDPHFVEIYKASLEQLSSEYDRQRLLHGDWEAEEDVENPFLIQFEDSKHISSEAIYRPNRQLIIIIDFNKNPFCLNFAHVYEDGTTMYADIFDEWSIQSGNIPKIIQRLRDHPEYSKRLQTCFITGDSTGKAGVLAYENNKSYFSKICETLGISQSQRKIRTNPLHKTSRDDCNYFLYHFHFRINPKCINTIRDCRIVQADSEGKIVKSNRSKVEQQADHLDNVRYLIHNFCYKSIASHRRMKSFVHN